MGKVMSMLLLQLVVCFTYAQDWSWVDQQVRGINEDRPALLAAKVTERCQTDREKVRAIFRWITDNISYNRPSARAVRWKDDNLGYQFPEDTGAITPLTERVASKVLKDRRTHCEGYARLFQSLCGHVGINAVIVTGYARNGMASKFRSNHSWNAVWVDSAWHLLDVTWAAGHSTYQSSDFIQNYNDYYFFTPPDLFARHHYPDDLRWTLLENPPVIDELRRTPYRQRSYGKYLVRDYAPGKGIIEAGLGDTLRFELETDTDLRYRFIAPDTLWDPETMIPAQTWAFLDPVQLAPDKKGKSYYEYVVVDEKIEWLHVMFNRDAVLRYRLKIRNHKTIPSVTDPVTAENRPSESFPFQ